MSDNRAFNWDDVIQNDSSFVLLPEGTYPFVVKGFERGYHNGSDRMPACNKAVLTLEVDGGSLGTVELTENLFLHSRAEWKLCEFFTAIGQRRKGEALTMNWNTVTGARGMAEVGIREWKGKDGSPRKSNQIQHFCEPSPTAAPAQAAPAAGFTAGQF